MKTPTITIILLFFLYTSFFAQETESKLPSVDIKTLNGEVFNTSNISNEGPIFVTFWATWCKPCIKELIAIDENYVDWKDETGLKVYAISIDDSRSQSRVIPIVNSKAWEFEILLDENSDFKRAMNVANIPHSFILDKDGNIVWQHVSYSPGDEEEIYETLLKLSEENQSN